MFNAKLKFKINHILARIKNIELNWGHIASRLFYLLIIFGIGVNIYITFDKGLTTSARFNEEQEKLEVIKAENLKLLELVKEYDSLEYKRIYARDNLNLGHDNESIYFVDRPEELPEIEPLLNETFRINFENKLIYWLKLLFG